MVNKIKYVSHSGVEIPFDKQSGYRIASSEHRDFSVGYKTMSNKIVGLRHENNPFAIGVVIKGNNANALRNKFYEETSKDVLYKTPGKLYDGDFYREGFIVSSKKSNWFNPYYSIESIEFLPTDGYWYRDVEKTFIGGSSDGLDYSHDFAFDFASSVSSDSIMNENHVPSFVRIAIQGAAESPSVTIGGNRYKVDVDVSSGERLEIDGQAKTVEIIASDGTRTNVFDKRAGNQTLGSGEYVFEKIPSGESPIVYDNGLRFSVTVIEQRAEPRWS